MFDLCSGCLEPYLSNCVHVTYTKGLVGWVVGQVDLLHGLPLAVGAVIAAPLGVWLNRRLPVMTLRRVFGVLLAAIGADLVIENLR